MLHKLLESGFADDLNCAETMLSGGNQAYSLNLDEKALKLAGPFGGGMAIESVCGALTGALMVIGRLFVEDRQHTSPRVKELTQRFLRRYEQEMGSLQCGPLKARYRTKELGCKNVISAAARILDEVIAEAERDRGPELSLKRL